MTTHIHIHVGPRATRDAGSPGIRWTLKQDTATHWEVTLHITSKDRDEWTESTNFPAATKEQAIAYARKEASEQARNLGLRVLN